MPAAARSRKGSAKRQRATGPHDRRRPAPCSNLARRALRSSAACNTCDAPSVEGAGRLVWQAPVRHGHKDTCPAARKMSGGEPLSHATKPRRTRTWTAVLHARCIPECRPADPGNRGRGAVRRAHVRCPAARPAGRAVPHASADAPNRTLPAALAPARVLAAPRPGLQMTHRQRLPHARPIQPSQLGMHPGLHR